MILSGMEKYDHMTSSNSLNINSCANAQARSNRLILREIKTNWKQFNGRIKYTACPIKLTELNTLTFFSSVIYFKGS